MGFLSGRAVLAFLVWTVTSFLCHQCAKLFLRSLGSAWEGGLQWAAVLTAGQALACYHLTDVQLPGQWSSKKGRLFLVKASTHVLATLATNYSLACMQAASTMAVKLLEPLTSALVQWLVLGVPLSLAGRLSLPLVVAGAVLFVGGPAGGGGGAAMGGSSSSSQALGAGLALASNLLLAARNLAVKLEQQQQQQGNTHSRLRNTRRLSLALGVSCLPLPWLLYLRLAGPDSGPSLLRLCVLCWLSSLFHVVYSHVSTGVVLRYLSVVSHAVANILKRMLVVLLLYAAGQRTASLGNFLGLLMCAAGLSLYAWGKLEPTSRERLGRMRRRMLAAATLATLGLVALAAILSQLSITASLPSGSDPRSALSRSVLALDSPEGALHSAPDDVTGPGGSVLDLRLAEHPLQADAVSPLLRSSRDIIGESQRIHLNVFSDLLSQYRFAVLLDVAAFENKGDPAITAGELYLLRRLGIQVVHYCSSLTCTEANLAFSRRVAGAYSPRQLVVLIHGGGNLVGYAFNDYLRKSIFEAFQGYHKVIFPQSVYLKEDSGHHLLFCRRLYSGTDNLTMVLRDRESFDVAEFLFRGKPRLLMAPDMAFQIGEVRRFMPPVYDVLWLKRTDDESPLYKTPAFPEGLSVRVADWWKWKTPKGMNSLENAVLIVTNGLMFLQRGRVVITDRLHGHILCTLLNIPHVLIDNKYRKLTNYHHTWTRSSDITVVARDAEDAVEQAVLLLEKFRDVLPTTVPFVDVLEFEAAVSNYTERGSAK